MQTRKQIAITKQDSKRKFYHLSNDANFVFVKQENYTENLSNTRLGYFGQMFLETFNFTCLQKFNACIFLNKLN